MDVFRCNLTWSCIPLLATVWAAGGDHRRSNCARRGCHLHITRHLSTLMAFVHICSRSIQVTKFSLLSTFPRPVCSPLLPIVTGRNVKRQTSLGVLLWINYCEQLLAYASLTLAASWCLPVMLHCKVHLQRGCWQSQAEGYFQPSSMRSIQIAGRARCGKRIVCCLLAISLQAQSCSWISIKDWKSYPGYVFFFFKYGFPMFPDMWRSADCRRPRLACSVLGVTACFSEVQNSCCAASWHHPPLKQVSGQCASLLHAHPPIGLVSFILLYHIDIHRPCFIPLLVGLNNTYIYIYISI